MSPKSLLLQAVRDKARLRRLSSRTVRAYVGWIRRFIRFHGRRHPRELGDGAVTSFLNHLVLARGAGALVAPIWSVVAGDQVGGHIGGGSKVKVREQASTSSETFRQRHTATPRR